MSDKRYDVFISYRNNGGAIYARLIYYALKSLGFEVFLDVECLGQGYNLENLMDEIEKCEDFVLILSPGALDTVDNEYDWVRLEAEGAVKLGKNIIPALFDRFSFPNNLSDSLKFLRTKVGIHFSEDMNVCGYYITRLADSLKSKPRYKLIQADRIIDEWSDILAAIDNGSVQDRYKVGEWKSLDLGKFGVIIAPPINS